MKIGDKFKHTATNSEYMFIGEAGSTAIRILDLKSGKTLSCFDNNIDDPYNITKEDFRRIIDITLPEYPIYSDMNGQPLFPDPTYSYGDNFVVTESRFPNTIGDKLKLCQVESSRVALISMNSGNRYSDPIIVENPTAITEEELNLVLGKNLSKIIKIQKIV